MRLRAPPAQRRLVTTGVILLLASMLVSACLGGGDASAVPTLSEPTATAALVPSVTATAAQRTPTPTEAAVMTVTMTPRPYPRAVYEAIDTAAEEFDVRRDRIDVADYRQVNWPSTALGCPEEGKFYAQIVTPGYEVDLDVAGRPVTYHTDQTGSAVVSC